MRRATDFNKGQELSTYYTEAYCTVLYCAVCAYGSLINAAIS